jgi:DNA polymerase phi
MDVEANGDAEDDEDESSDEEVWDDEQMMKVDEQLAAVFRDRAAAGSGKKVDKSEFLQTNQAVKSSSPLLTLSSDLQTESIHFKARIIDLYDVYAKKQPQNPLVIELLLPLLTIIKNSGNAAAALSNKASSLIRSRFAKPKDLPTGVSPSDGKLVLEGIHDMARKTYSGEFTALCSICSVFVARSMDASVSNAHIHQVVDVYSKTMDEYMTHKATQLHATFLNDYFKRHTLRAWPLHATLLPYLQPGKTVNIYRQTVAYELLALLASQMPGLAKTHSAEVNALIPQAVNAFYATLESAKSDEGWKADRLKEFFKSVLAFARATKVVGYEWDVERLDQVKEGLKESRLAKVPSVNSLFTQLRAVVGKDKAESKSKAKAKDSKSARSKKRSNGDADMDVDEDALPPVVAPKKRKESSISAKPSKKAKAPKA